MLEEPGGQAEVKAGPVWRAGGGGGGGGGEVARDLPGTEGVASPEPLTAARPQTQPALHLQFPQMSDCQLWNEIFQLRPDQSRANQLTLTRCSRQIINRPPGQDMALYVITLSMVMLRITKYYMVQPL